MTSQQIMKEARPLFWPWCGVVLAGLSPLIFVHLGFPELTNSVWTIGWVAGIPLLATLPLGLEFQNQTISLLLAQPVHRTKIWTWKIGLAGFAAVSVIPLFVLMGYQTKIVTDAFNASVIGFWVVPMVAGAVYWTLFTRSMMGGVVLNLAVGLLITISINQLFSLPAFAVPKDTALYALFFMFFGYAAAMLWLGRHLWERFQVAGDVAIGDVLTVKSDFLPSAFKEVFRCRPNGAMRNLFLKELRLLRPVWLLGLLSAAAWIALCLLAFHTSQESLPHFTLSFGIVAGFTVMMATILSGALPFGEERSLGTHAGQMALPVSAGLQWRAKFYVALFASFTTAWLVPWISTQILIEHSRLHATDSLELWLIVVMLLTLVSFWCASALNSTVAAAMWVLPTLIVLGLSVGVGAKAASIAIDHLVSTLNPFASLKFVQQFFPSDYSTSPLWNFYFNNLCLSSKWVNVSHWFLAGSNLALPMLLVAMVQSYRIFRQPARNGLQFARAMLAPLAAITLIYAFCWASLFSFVDRGFFEHAKVSVLLNHSLMSAEEESSFVPSPRPLRIVASDSMKRWELDRGPWRKELEGAMFTLVPMNPIPQSPHMFKWAGRTFLANAHTWRLATISLPHASDCTQSYGTWNNRSATYTLVVICK